MAAPPARVAVAVVPWDHERNMVKAFNGVLLIFAKAPLPGQAKTRLIPALGDSGAASLQQFLLTATLATAEKWQGGAIQLWCTPSTDHPAFLRCAEQHPLSLHPQQGGDLGTRMAHAFEVALREYDWAIVIGTDCPDLTAADLQHAAELLRQGADAVIGPAADGGYYLLGLRRFEPGLFSDIEWGGSKVLAETLQRLRHHGMLTRQLAVKHDLDRPEDLKRFPQRLPIQFIKGC